MPPVEYHASKQQRAEAGNCPPPFSIAGSTAPKHLTGSLAGDFGEPMQRTKFAERADAAKRRMAARPPLNPVNQALDSC